VIALAAALAIALSLSGASDVEVALKRGAQLEAAGHNDAAAQTYRSALEAAPPGSRERARMLVALSTVETTLGNYAASHEHAAEAATIYERTGDSRGQALALNRIGLAALYSGAYRDAGTAFESAISISTAVGDKEGRAKDMTNLGNVYLYLGRYSDAERIYGDALDVIKNAGSEDWVPRRRRLVLANKAALLSRVGQHQEALALFRELASGGDVRPEEQAQVFSNIGVQYRRLGDPMKALASYERALKIFARNPHMEGELNAMKNRGIVLLELERFEDAERTFSKVLKAARRVGNRREELVTLRYRGEAREHAGQGESAREDYRDALSLARELGHLHETPAEAYGLARVPSDHAAARDYLLQAVDVIERIRDGIHVPEMRSDFFKDKREVYDALIAARLQHASTADMFALIEQRHSRGWRDILHLASAIDLVSVQRALPDGALLLDYWNAPIGSALVAVTRTRAAVFPVSVNAEDVTALINRLAAGPQESWREYSASIAAHILPPAEWLTNVSQVIVVADGALALVPFEALATGDRLLIQRAAVSYTPSAATLLRTMPDVPSWSPPWRLQLEAFAAPVFAQDADDAATRHRALGSAAREVTGIASELGGMAVLHIGRDDVKAGLVKPLHAPILHLATHAMADATAMEQSRIVFSPARASETAPDYLFLREAYELPLANVDLAVLSACDTERGSTARGDGVQSFSRAFLAAGARSTVTTLWRVADEPTAGFMRVFYHHLQRGASKAEALRRAKLRFLESGSTLSHPHFWAAFVLTGDGLRPVPRAPSWRTVLGFSLLLMVIVAGAIAVIHTRQRNRGLMQV